MKDINTFNFSLSKLDKNFIVSLFLSEKGSSSAIKSISLSNILRISSNSYLFIKPGDPLVTS